MRTVLSSHSEVAHYWANQVQSEGRANNMLFNRESIYSYGTHFEIARIVKPNAVFFNPERYSSSTSKHQCIVRRSIPANMEIFEIDGFDNDHKHNLQQYIEQIKELRAKAVRARKYKDYYLDSCREKIGKIERYLELFQCKSKLPPSMRKLIESFIGIKDDILSPEAVEAIKQQQERERKEKERKFKQKISDWRNGLIHSLYGLSHAILRLKDDVIQTSQGATVSLKSARVLWQCLKAGKSIRGLKLDERYTIIGLADDILQIGCHKIRMTEVNRLAKALNW